MAKINQYPIERLTFGDDDYYDIDYWDGATYQTAKIKGSTIKAGIQAGITGQNIYTDNGTLTTDRTMDGANFELFFQELGAFIVHSHKNNTDNVVFEVRSQSGFESFTVRDHNTGDHLFCIENGKVEINDAYFLPNVDGTSGQVMKTDGLGNVTWQDEATGVSGSGTNERLAVWSPNGTTLDDTEIYYNVSGARVGFGANYTANNRVYIEQTSNGDEPLRAQTVRGDLITANSIVGISNVANSVSGLTNNGVIGVGHGQTDIDSYNIGITGQAGNIRPTISKKGNIGGLFYTQLGNRTNYGAQFITTGSNTEDNYGIFIENYNLGSGNSHAVWIIDRNEAVGKVLTCRTVDGKGGWEALPYDFNFACGDEVTPIVVASALTTLRAPRSFKINSVRASLTTAGGTSGVTRFDIKVNGTSILNPTAPLEIDFGDKTSTTATVQPIIAIPSVFVDSEITVDCTAITGSGTEAGAKIYLIGELE